MVDEERVQDQYQSELGGAESSDVSTPALIQPAESGTLEHLKTTLELRAGDTLLEIYFTEIPVKSANNVLK